MVLGKFLKIPVRINTVTERGMLIADNGCQLLPEGLKGLEISVRREDETGIIGNHVDECEMLDVTGGRREVK
jgi:hypothetical protein